jgi:hydroxypyruvate isomerase
MSTFCVLALIETLRLVKNCKNNYQGLRLLFDRYHVQGIDATIATEEEKRTLTKDKPLHARRNR